MAKKINKHHKEICLPQLSNAGSFLLSHLAFNAYFNILSDASTEVTSNPSSRSKIESTLQK